MSIQARFNFPVKKLSSSKENTKSPGVKRSLFSKAHHPASPEKPRPAASENEKPSSKLHSLTKSPNLTKAKQAFHTGIPSRLVGRSKEISDIRLFLHSHLSGGGGSMYMSGAPGTGKTSSLMYVVNSLEKKNFKFIFANCMSINPPASIYKTIAKELGITASKNLPEAISKKITSPSAEKILLVLDEIDRFDVKEQQILYTMFEWPHLAKSSLTLVGIANALNFTDRLLPRLTDFRFQPKLLQFQPYTREQIASILEDRLKEAEGEVIRPAALQLCARRVAANTGDVRKALDVCRRAIEVVESKKEASPVALKSTSDDRLNPGSPCKRPTPNLFVDLQEISAVLHEVYGSRLQTSAISSSCPDTVSMPLQHILLICTLTLLKKHLKNQDITMGKAYDTFRRVCAKRNLSLGGDCEFRSLCRLVEARGFLQLKENKVPRLSKVVLKIDEQEAEHVLKDKTVLSAVLSDVSVLK